MNAEDLGMGMKLVYITAAGHFTDVNCFHCVFPEIVTTTGSYFVSFDSAEERDGWIESIRKASVSRLNHACV